MFTNLVPSDFCLLMGLLFAIKQLWLYRAIMGKYYYYYHYHYYYRCYYYLLLLLLSSSWDTKTLLHCCRLQGNWQENVALVLSGCNWSVPAVLDFHSIVHECHWILETGQNLCASAVPLSFRSARCGTFLLSDSSSVYILYKPADSIFDRLVSFTGGNRKRRLLLLTVLSTAVLQNKRSSRLPVDWVWEQRTFPLLPHSPLRHSTPPVFSQPFQPRSEPSNRSLFTR